MLTLNANQMPRRKGWSSYIGHSRRGYHWLFTHALQNWSFFLFSAYPGWNGHLRNFNNRISPLPPTVAISYSIYRQYFLFLLYFDQVEVNRFGTIRQHFWALLHYPLHVAYILTLDGVNQLALFAVAYHELVSLGDFVAQIFQIHGQSKPAVAQAISEITDLVSKQGVEHVPIPANINDTLSGILAGNVSTNLTADAHTGDGEKLILAINAYLIQTYGYNVGSYDESGFEKFTSAFSTAYVYFFIAAGGALITLAALLWLGKKDKSVSEHGSITVRLLVGAALCLVTTTYTGDGAYFINFLISGWTLPTVMLLFGLGDLILLLNQVHMKSANSSKYSSWIGD